MVAISIRIGFHERRGNEATLIPQANGNTCLTRLTVLSCLKIEIMFKTSAQHSSGSFHELKDHFLNSKEVIEQP